MLVQLVIVRAILAIEASLLVIRACSFTAEEKDWCTSLAKTQWDI
jgi:hypothetical protein